MNHGSYLILVHSTSEVSSKVFTGTTVNEKLDKCWKRDNFVSVANICAQVFQTFYLNCVTPVASRASGGHGGKHRNLPIFASALFSS